MPSINNAASGHVGPAPLPGGHQYLTYTNKHHLHVLARAFGIIDGRIKGYKPCNAAFKALPNGRTFDEIWSDPSIWINADPSIAGGDYGATRGNDITITAFSLNMGIWTTAATLVHELAHVDGASGSTHDAEATLHSCLLAGLEDKSIIGAITKASVDQIA